MHRFHVVMDVIERASGLGVNAVQVTQVMHDKLAEHRQYIQFRGEDVPEIRDSKWAGCHALASGA